MVRLVASQILLLDYAQLWSTSQFVCAACRVDGGGSYRNETPNRKAKGETNDDNKKEENSFIYVLMSANNDDNLFMFNAVKLRRKEATLPNQTRLYLFSDNNY